MSINIKETLDVKPTRPTQHSPIILSNHDLFMPMVYINALHFFKNVNNKIKFMNPHKLHASLEDILSDYYPLAGRLKDDPEGRLCIVCTEQGIPFILAESPDITIEQLEENNWQPSLFPEKLRAGGPIDGVLPVSTDVPLFMVQHTTLADGSVVLGTSVHHSIADGCGFFSLLENWGRKTRQKPIISPVHDRSLLKASGNPPTHEHHEFIVKPPAAINTKSFDVNKSSALPAMPSMPSMITKLFYFSKDNLKKLHDVYSCKNGWVSTNDVLVAHIWRTVTRARGISLDTQVLCGISSNGRERLKPSFPSSYFGNCSLNVNSSMLVSELINGPQSNVALQIRKAVAEMDDSKIRSSIDWIEQQSNKRGVRPNLKIYCGKDFIMTNWSKFPLYDVDFGDGTPYKFSLGRGKNLDGIAAILSTKSNEIEVYLGLITEHMQKLEQDPEFKEFL